MLNGDYAAEILGSGINAGEMEGQCPLVIITAERRARFPSGVVCVTWTSCRPEQHLAWNLFSNWLSIIFTYYANGKFQKFP